MRLRALLFLGAIIHALPAHARDMVIALQGGPVIEEILRQALLRPFSESSGLQVHSVGWAGGLEALQGSPAEAAKWDLVQLDAGELHAACDQGLLEKLDWTALGGRDHFVSGAAADCGAGAFLHSLVLAWSPEKFPGTPSWSDFWDVAKVPGKRGLQRRARDNLEIALLADGVAPADVYTTLRTNDGVNRAFRKLDQLKPYLVWWQADTPPVHLLNSGDVLMSSAPNEQVSEDATHAAHKLSIQWSGGLYSIASWAILKGSTNLADANRFLAFAADPARAASLLPLGSAIKGASDHLSAEQAAMSPSAPANLANALRSDAGFWHDNGPRLEARFQDWVTH